MKKLRFMLVVVATITLLCHSPGQFNKGVTGDDYSRLGQIVKAGFGERYRISDLLNPDSSYPGMFPSLSQTFVFASYARGMTPPAPFVGVIAGDQVVWTSETEAGIHEVPAIDQIADVNRDGRPEIFVLFSGGVSSTSHELWIYVWDGTSGRRVNPVENGRSRMGFLDDPEAYQFVDTNGDGIMEIRLHNLEDETLFFYWDGTQYREGTPQPFTVLPRNNLAVDFRSTVDANGQTLRYRYFIHNHPSSQQSADDFMLEPAAGLQITAITGRPGWKPASGPSFIRWTNLYWFGDKNYIAPGETDSNFSVQRGGVPGIGKYYVQGHNGDEFSGIGIQTNSANGSAITPADPPNPFIPLAFADTLSSYTTQSRTLGWITTQATADRYLGYFASAKTALQANNIPAVQSTLSQVLSDVNVDSSGTLTSEAYALIRFNTEYLLSHLPSSEAGFSYSLFASHSMHLQQNADVFSGDIGVNEAGSSPFLDSQVELSVGISTSIAPGCSVKANRIKVKQGATVAGEVFYNTLDNNGSITGTTHSPLTLTLTSGLPEFKPASPGTQDVTIPQNGTQSLSPGAYKDILVRKNGTLTFTGGVYHLASLNTGDNVKLLFQGASEVRIAGKFDTDQGTYTGPQDTTTLSANQIIFYVAGINGSNGNLGATPKAAQIGIANTVNANFYVPNGTLWIRQNSKATGAFIGKDVDVGIGVEIRKQSGF